MDDSVEGSLRSERIVDLREEGMSSDLDGRCRALKDLLPLLEKLARPEEVLSDAAEERQTEARREDDLRREVGLVV